MKTLSIIGFGRFGQLAAEHLKGHFELICTDSRDMEDEAAELGVRFSSLEDCASADYILVAVPISVFEDTIKSIAGDVRKQATVIDVCSVKEHPLEVMKRHLKCNIAATHPLFGPDSTKDGIKGKEIVVCEGDERLLSFLIRLGLKVIRISAEDHDRDMARSLALIHLIGRALMRIDSDKVQISTPTHARFLEIIEITRNDSEQLFLDMHRFNRHTKKVRKELINELVRLEELFQKS